MNFKGLICFSFILNGVLSASINSTLIDALRQPRNLGYYDQYDQGYQGYYNQNDQGYLNQNDQAYYNPNEQGYYNQNYPDYFNQNNLDYNSNNQINNDYYPNVFVASPCGQNTCPSGCPGQCGSFNGDFACKCPSNPSSSSSSSSSSYGQICTIENINSGKYLYPYPPDAKKYIQCDHQPGVYFIRDCGPGTVFDSRFSVCNYPLPTNPDTVLTFDNDYLSQCCTYENINKGLFLFPYPNDRTKYIQCDHAPGLYFIRNCGPGTEFDSRFSVCGYPSGSHGK